MKYLFKIFVPSILFIVLFSVPCNAQINNNRYKVGLNPQDIGPCGGANNSRESVKITGKNATCHAFSITFDLPEGITFVSGTATIDSQTNGTGGFTIVASGTASDPIFTIEKPSDANWIVGETIQFSFERKASCDAVDHLNNNGLFKDAHTIQYSDNTGSNSATDDEVTTSSYILLAPAVNVSNINTILVNVSESYTRDVTIAQGGYGCISSLTHVVVPSANVDDVYTLSYGGITLIPDDDTAGVLTYIIDLTAAPFLSIGNGNGCFDNGENIVLTESFRVDGCTETSIAHTASWGCETGTFCQSSETQTGFLNFGTAPPIITATQTGDSKPDFCKIKNLTVELTGSGANAFDVDINLGAGHNRSTMTTHINNPLWAFDHNDVRQFTNFKIGNTPVTPIDYVSDNYPTYGNGNTFRIPANYLTTDPDGPGVGLEDLDNDGFFDDLPVGETITITMDIEITPKDKTCNQGRTDYLVWEHIYFDVIYKDQCYTPISDPNKTGRVDLGYFNLIRDYHEITSTNAPTDIDNNSSFVITINPQLFRSGSNMPEVDGEDVFSSSSNSTFTTSITLPTGFSLNSSASSEYTVSGNIVTYTTTDLSTAIGSSFIPKIDFPLNYTCGTNGIKNIPFTTNLTLSGSNGECFNQDISCGDVNIYTHCPGPCTGPLITEFDANRITAGWTDQELTTLVDLDENTDGIKTYLPGDKMKLSTKAVIHDATLNNLFLDVTYTVPDDEGGSSVINYLEGEITINDLSSGAQSTALIGNPVLTTVNTNEHTLTFDLSAYRSIINSNYEFGEDGDIDEIEVDIIFKFNNNFDHSKLFELTNFRGAYYSFSDYPTNTQKLICDNLGDIANYFNFAFNTSNISSSGRIACSPVSDLFYLSVYTPGSDFHLDEYRPLFKWKSLVINLPEGATFTGIATGHSLSNGAISTTNGGIIAEENNGVLTLTPGPNYRVRDQQSYYYPNIAVQLVGNCKSQTTEVYSSTYTYDKYVYLPEGEWEEVTSTQGITFLYNKPTFFMQSPKPTINGTGTEAEFDVEISNTSTEGVAYNWLQATSPTGLQITDVYMVNAGVETPLTYYQNLDKIWVELGSLTSSETKNIRFKANYNSCNDLTVLFEHGWDCSGYPGYKKGATNAQAFLNADPCSSTNTSITLEPKESQVQLAITSQPITAISLCTPFYTQLEVNSAKIANLINPYIEFSIPGGANGMTINSVQVVYPKGSTNPADTQTLIPIITGNTARINLTDHTGIAINSGILGNPAENSIPERTAVIDFNLQLECAFIANSAINYKVFGESPCGDPTLGNGTRATTDNLQVLGATQPYDAFTTLTLPNNSTIQGCDTQETINVATTIVGGTTGNEDFGLITLRPGIVYVENSFSVNGSYIAILEEVNTVGNHQELVIKYPQGVPNAAVIDFDFDVVTTFDGGCESTPEIEVTNYVEISGMSCDSTNCPTFYVSTGFSYETLRFEKPSLIVISNATGIIEEQTDNSYDYTISADFTNNGTIEASAGYVYSVYCSDATGTITGTVIGTGTLSNAIPSTATVTQSLTFSSTTLPCTTKNIVIELVPSSTNCLCDALLFNIAVNQVPIAVDDSSTGNTTGNTVSIDVTDNDHDPDGTIDPTTVSFNTSSIATGVCNSTNSDGNCTQVTVAGEGVWTVNSTSGLVTFTPESGFTNDPTPIEYTVNDNEGATSNTATIRIDYIAQPPVAINDSSTGNTTGNPTTISVIDNDNDPDGTIDPTTVSLDASSIIGGVCNTTDSNGYCIQVTVATEGIWTVNQATGEVTFTPNIGFTADPTPMAYTIEDNDANVSNTATITIDYNTQDPVANDDTSNGNTTGTAVTIAVTDNDADPDGTIDSTTVSLIASSITGGVCNTSEANGDCTRVTVSGEGVWTVNSNTGEVTFSPAIGFTADPIPISYTVADNDGNKSNVATITIDYNPQSPIANDDLSSGNTTGEPTNISVTDNDNDPDGTIDPTTVNLIASSISGGICNTTDANGNCTKITVPNEGVWTMDPNTGVVTFTPEIEFIDNPTAIQYNVQDNDGNQTNTATITITYDACNGKGTADCDGDGVPNKQEKDDGTDPNNPCEYVIDNATLEVTENYLNADCDGDGVTNGAEITDGTNPEDPCDYDRSNITLEQSGDYLISDCDGDGIINGTEISDNTDPDDPCDYLSSSITLDRSGAYLEVDCDNDQISNGQEISDGTDPDDPCDHIGGTTPEGIACDIIFENDLVDGNLIDGVFKITNIASFPDNTVHIYNRWGVLVFETKGYNNTSNGFKGISNGRVTIKQNEQLPTGTYFYVVDYVIQGQAKKKTGYLYVIR